MTPTAEPVGIPEWNAQFVWRCHACPMAGTSATFEEADAASAAHGNLAHPQGGGASIFPPIPEGAAWGPEEPEIGEPMGPDCAPCAACEGCTNDAHGMHESEEDVCFCPPPTDAAEVPSV